MAKKKKQKLVVKNASLANHLWPAVKDWGFYEVIKTTLEIVEQIAARDSEAENIDPKDKKFELATIGQVRELYKYLKASEDRFESDGWLNYYIDLARNSDPIGEEPQKPKQREIF